MRATRSRDGGQARRELCKRDDEAAKVIADGRALGELGADGKASVRLGERSALLALLPEMTFFHRYRETFAS